MRLDANFKLVEEGLERLQKRGGALRSWMRIGTRFYLTLEDGRALDMSGGRTAGWVAGVNYALGLEPGSAT